MPYYSPLSYDDTDTNYTQVALMAGGLLLLSAAAIKMRFFAQKEVVKAQNHQDENGFVRKAVLIENFTQVMDTIGKQKESSAFSFASLTNEAKDQFITDLIGNQLKGMISNNGYVWLGKYPGGETMVNANGAWKDLTEMYSSMNDTPQLLAALKPALNVNIETPVALKA